MKFPQEQSMNPADYIASIGAVLTGIGLIYAGLQLKYAGLQVKHAGLQLEFAQKVSKAQFLLQLDILLKEHETVARDLRGRWRGEGGPATLEEWIAVERYMGLFERIQILIEDGVVDLKTFDQLYGYRIFYITENSVIHDHKLVERKDQWAHFIRLWDSLKKLERDRQMYSANIRSSQQRLTTESDVPTKDKMISEQEQTAGL
jgi:hypothetical protein